ncbi:hypothetical protein SAMN07250955_102130 [Arboricoccus pini]|uniref:Uncharacterized protein n=1 Tax=Arboricoccus pini TaxID=1963835 RepID=A0A212QPE6_9PROT|nr:hypothetical protein SAMN07250955_102130 [Arboricoccus pini]
MLARGRPISRSLTLGALAVVRLDIAFYAPPPLDRL